MHQSILTKADFHGARNHRYAGPSKGPKPPKAPKPAARRRSVYFDLFEEIARDQAEFLKRAA